MSASKKLSTAVKALYFLAETDPEPQNSITIANGIGSNASKLRQILSMLVKNNIIKSTYGTNGGFLIAKNINEIHLQEVYCAVEDRKAFYLDVSEVNGTGMEDAKKMNGLFLNLFSDIQVEIENKMRKIYLNNIIEQIKLTN
ncbi:MAG: Rrf2 family transcriptional regulator [Ignavibacteriaceae bacterium]|nr:Rrf2 family transcriptional regulator [Ignavibacteriaceae bacterium]